MKTIEIDNLPVSWGESKEVTTKRGAQVIREAEATPEFWSLWENQKSEIRRAGVTVGNFKGKWVVTWWGADKEVNLNFALPHPTPAAITNTEVNWSSEQVAIFDWFKSGKGHLVVRARAGTGKTTTIKKAFSFAPEERMIYVVFNKKNQREAEQKITDPRVDVRTLHSLGFYYIKLVWKDAKPDDTVELDRLESLYKDLPDEVATAILKLVGFAKNTTISPTTDDLIEIADERFIEAPAYEDEEHGGWTTNKIASVALKVMNLAKERDKENRISYNDMVWLPVAMNWVMPMFDLVCVDEAQDMNLPQLTMAQKACNPGGRICVVGDDRQAIYGFRGAVQDGIDMMKAKLGAAELGLTITYRCPKKVVALAAALVPDYKAAASAPEGVVDYISEGGLIGVVQVGDAVLSRINAPLMPLCLQLLRNGVSARIEGRDIGKQLANLAKKMKAKSVPDFIKKIEKWGDKMKKRAGNGKHAEQRLEQIRDQVETLVAVADGATNVKEIESRLLDLFQDSDQNPKPAVVFSSVHKSKGLEWPRVFILQKTFNKKGAKGGQTEAQKQEEKNIYYVAITRAQNQLVFAADSGPVGVTSGTASGGENK